MLGIMHHRRNSSGPSRADLCVQGGCKCYCHEAQKKLHWAADLGLTFIMCVGAVALVMGGLMFLLFAQQREYAKHPPMPYYCTGMTSTGAPADCHPAVLAPEILKQYEDHFKK